MKRSLIYAFVATLYFTGVAVLTHGMEFESALLLNLKMTALGFPMVYLFNLIYDSCTSQVGDDWYEMYRVARTHEDNLQVQLDKEIRFSKPVPQVYRPRTTG